MSEGSAKVRFARRFVIQRTGHPDIHGVQFPSGLVLYDQPGIGLEAATSIECVRTDTPDITVHWSEGDG